MKNEMFYGHESEFHTFEQFKEAVVDYIDYYNNERIRAKQNGCPHQSLERHPYRAHDRI